MAARCLAVIVFLLVYLSGHSAEACGWNTSALSGTVQSPNFPNNYANGQSCVYVIKAPSGYQVTLTFTSFDLQDDGTCLLDYVDIHDGDSEDSPRIKRYCGTTLPSAVRTFYNQMRIKFVSDASGAGSGFNATFESAILQAPFFLITSSIPQSAVGGSIYRMDAETRSNYKIPLTSSLYSPIALDYDPVEKTVYWTEVGLLKGIRAASINGGSVRMVLDTGPESLVDGVALDPLSRLIFYTDTGRDLIAMLTMSTLNHKTIINTSLDQPRAIALNPAEGVMFWTDWGTSPKIERANYDGSDRKTLVGSLLYLVNALALDVPNNRLYWADAGTDRVEMTDLDGNGRTLLLALNSTFHFFGLALLEDSLYLSDWAGGGASKSQLIRLHIDSRNATVYGSTSGIRLNDIHAYLPQSSSDNSPNGCGDNNGGCDVICIPLPGNSSKCMCPDGQSLNSDQRTCGDGLDTTSMEAASTTTEAAPTTTEATSSVPVPFSVAVSTSDPQPFDTNGDREMTLTCDPDTALEVMSYAWNVPCVQQAGNMCVFKPRPVEDDGKEVTCMITSSDGRSSSGALEIELNYPPQDPPTISGISKDTVYQEGHRLTLTCSVHGGKPLVTSVLFSCDSHRDTSPVLTGSTEVHKVLIIDSLKVEDDGAVCFCTATWKGNNWYKLSATAHLSVNGSRQRREESTSLNIPVIAGGSAGAVVVVIVIIVVIVVIKRRGNETYAKPSRRRQDPSEEGPYRTLSVPGGACAGRGHHPCIHNRGFDDDQNGIYLEPNDIEHYNVAEAVGDRLPSAAGDDYLSPVPPPVPHEKKPVPCDWDKKPTANDDYIHAVSNPSHNDYVPFGFLKSS